MWCSCYCFLGNAVKLKIIAQLLASDVQEILNIIVTVSGCLFKAFFLNKLKGSCYFGFQVENLHGTDWIFMLCTCNRIGTHLVMRDLDRGSIGPTCQLFRGKSLGALGRTKWQQVAWPRGKELQQLLKDYSSWCDTNQLFCQQNHISKTQCWWEPVCWSFLYFYMLSLHPVQSYVQGRSGV